MKKLNTLRFQWLLVLLVLIAISTEQVLATSARVSAYGNITTGKTYWIGATTSSTDYYFKANDGIATSSSNLSGTSTTTPMTDGTVVKITISGTSGNVQFTNNNHMYLPDSNGKYKSQTSTATWTFSNNSSLIRMVCNNCALQKNSSTSLNFGAYSKKGQKDVWLEPALKVTYNANNATSGNVPTDNSYYLTGTTVTVKANSGTLARSGYTFAGWNTKDDGTGTNYTAGSGTFNISGDVTLYAKWTATAACTDDPSVSGSGNGSISCTTATINCNNGSSKGVVKGSCDISEWGFVYGTSSNPEENKTSKGTESSTDVANFSHTFTGLTPGQQYYVRAYAIVNGTTYYGTETNFTTKTITVTSNDDDFGSVSGEGLSWTGSPNSGYVYASPAYTITAGNNTEVTKVGNAFTISSTSTENVAITINFEPKGCSDHYGNDVETATSTSGQYGPVYPYFKYSTRQILYTKEDLGLATGKKGIIKSIYFMYGYSSATTTKTDVDIYMVNSDITELSTSAGHYVTVTSSDKVYSGALNGSGKDSWNEIVLTTPFNYDGVGNLIVVIDDNSGFCEASSSFVFNTHTTSTNYSQLSTYSDDTNADPSAAATWTGASTSNIRPSTKFCIEEKPMSQYTVNWYVNSATPIHSQTGYAGTALTNIPEPESSDCDGEKVFVGWYTESYSHATNAPAFVNPTTIPEGGANYYAVFATNEGSTATPASFTSTFTDKSWSEASSRWSSGKAGDDFVDDRGIKLLGSSSANATTVDSYSNITSVVVNYCTNSSTGAGTINIEVGENSMTGNATVTTSGGATPRPITYTPNSPSTALSGKVKITASASANSIYITSIQVNYSTGGTTYSNYATTCCTKLIAPTNVTATATGATTTTVTWDAVENANGYQYKLGDADWATAEVTGEETKTLGLTGLTSATSYAVQVRATGTGDYCAAGIAANAVNFKTYATVTAATNDNEKGTAQVSLNNTDWASSVAVAEGTVVYLKATPIGTNLFDSWAASNGTLTNAESATTTLEAESWTGDVTVMATFVPAQKETLSTPTGLASAVTAISATIKWNVVANASSYQYKLGEGEWTDANVMVTEGVCSCELTGLTAGTQYSWQVKAIGDDVNYTNSDAAAADFTTDAKAATSIEVTGTLTKSTYVEGETFDMAGLTITVHYNTGESDNEYTITPNPLTLGTTSVTITSNLTSAVTAVVNDITVLKKVVLTFMNNGVEVSHKDLYEGAEYEELLTLESSAACDATSKTFIGWTNGEIVIKQDEQPTLAKATDHMGESNVTLHAVWAKASATPAADQVHTWSSPTWTTATAFAYGVEQTVDVDGKEWKYAGYAQNGNSYLQVNTGSTKLSYFYFPEYDESFIIKSIAFTLNNNSSNSVFFTDTKPTTAALSPTSYANISFSTATTLNTEACAMTSGYVYYNGSAQIKSVSVTYAKSITYADYMTTCSDDVHSIAYATELTGGEVSGPTVALEGSEVTLTATPAEGYNFGAWNVYKTGDTETTVTVNNNKFEMTDYDVTVSATFAAKALESFELSASELNKEVGETAVTLTATTFTPSDFLDNLKQFNWSSSNTNVATVTEEGVVSFVGVGSATITAAWATNSEVKATCAVTVVAATPVLTLTAENLAFGEVDLEDVNKELSTVSLKGLNLVDNVTYEITGTNASLFTVETALDNDVIGTEEGQALTIRFAPGTVGNKSATITFSSGVASASLAVTGTGVQRFTVTLNAGTGSVTPASLKQETAGGEVALPTPILSQALQDDGWTFHGWATDPLNDEVETAPTTTYTGSYTPMADITLNAIYKRVNVVEGQASRESGLAASTTAYAVETGKPVTMVCSESNAYSDPLRLYSAKTLTINGNGATLKEIQFIITQNASNLSADKGTYTSSTQKWASTTGEGKVVFSANAQVRISKIVVSYETSTGRYWTKPAPLYTIEFNTNGGEGTFPSQKVAEGNDFVLDGNVPTLQWNDFADWYDGVANHYAKDATIENVQGNITLTAQWTEWEKATVTFMNHDFVNDVDVIVEAKADIHKTQDFTTSAAPASLVAPGATAKLFQGWSADGGLTILAADATAYMPEEAAPIIYHAIWKDKAAEPTQQIVVNADLSNGEWVLITAGSQLKEGDVVIVAEQTTLDGAIDAMGEQVNNYRAVASVEKSSNKITPTDDVTKLFVQVGVGNDKYAFYVFDFGNETGYLSNTENKQIGVVSTLTANESWTVTIDSDNTARIVNSATNIELFYNSSSPRFTCYANSQQPMSLYKWVKKISGTMNIEDVTLTDAVIVPNSATLNVPADASLESVIVEAGGKVSGSANLTVNDLTIKTSLGTINAVIDETVYDNKNGKSGEISNSNINASGEVWIEIELTQESEASYGWYAFSVPFRVDAMHGVYGKPDGEDWQELQNEVGYAIMSYHGDVRAQGLYGWKKYRDIMEPGTLYIIAVGKTEYKTLRFKKVADAAIVNENQVQVYQYPLQEGGQTGDQGWNGIGNPNLQVSHLEGDLQFLDHGNNRFILRDGSETKLLVGTAFMMQRGADETITIEAGAGSGSIALAPAREPRGVETQTFKVYLTDEATGKGEDNIFLRTSEEATNEYEVGRDLAKMSMGDAKCAQMWVPAYGTQLCAAYFPLINDKAEYPLSINTPKAGTYSISTVANENADLYLTYEGAIIWNLSMGAYEIELTKGTTSGYGIVLQAKAPNSATGVDEVTGDKVQCTKVVIDDHVYILRGEQLYGIDGKMVK